MVRPYVTEYRKVWNGDLDRTSGGLTRSALTTSKYSGQVVSKARQAHGRRMHRENNLAANQAPPISSGGSPVRRRTTTRRRRPAAKKPAATRWW